MCKMHHVYYRCCSDRYSEGFEPCSNGDACLYTVHSDVKESECPNCKRWRATEDRDRRQREENAHQDLEAHMEALEISAGGELGKITRQEKDAQQGHDALQRQKPSQEKNVQEQEDGQKEKETQQDIETHMKGLKISESGEMEKDGAEDSAERNNTQQSFSDVRKRGVSCSSGGGRQGTGKRRRV